MQKTKLIAERQQRHGQAISIVERRMQECSAQAGRCKENGDEPTMYRLNTAWHWLASVKRELEQLARRDAR